LQETPRGKPIRRRKGAVSESEAEEESDDETATETEAEAGPSKRRGETETRFAVGDGVSVAVEGGNEGIGMLTALWEEDGEDDDDESTVSGSRHTTPERETGPRMVARVHWFFRKEDLPGVMTRLALEEVSRLICSFICSL
jgi:origin recognition complex subunit 1